MIASTIVGFKNSGKTTLTLRVAEILKAKGHKAALAKHSAHGFDELPGRDTTRYQELGVEVAGISDERSFLSWPGKRHLGDLLPLMDADVLVVEGGKPLKWLPRVILADDAETAAKLEPELAIAIYGKAELPGVPTCATPEEVADAILERGFTLPGLDCGACGREDCRGLTADIVAGRATLADCAAGNASMRVAINGRTLGLNPFVADILTGGVMGMLSTLKGFAPGKIEITIEPK